MRTQDYLSAPVLYGGIWTTRGDVIADLQRLEATQAQIDRYLQGLDLYMKRLEYYLDGYYNGRYDASFGIRLDVALRSELPGYATGYCDGQNAWRNEERAE